MASWSNCRADKHHSSSTEAFRRTGGIIYMQIKLHICILASIRRQQCTQILTNESNGLFSYKEPNSAFSVCHHDPKQRISASSTRQLFSPIIWTCWHHTFWTFHRACSQVKWKNSTCPSRIRLSVLRGSKTKIGSHVFLRLDPTEPSCFSQNLRPWTQPENRSNFLLWQIFALCHWLLIGTCRLRLEWSSCEDQHKRLHMSMQRRVLWIISGCRFSRRSWLAPLLYPNNVLCKQADWLIQLYLGDGYEI